MHKHNPAKSPMISLPNDQISLPNGHVQEMPMFSHVLAMLKGCAPTLAMLKLSEMPVNIQLSQDIFGEINQESVAPRMRPLTSRCTSDRREYVISSFGSSSSSVHDPSSSPLANQGSPPRGQGRFHMDRPFHPHTQKKEKISPP